LGEKKAEIEPFGGKVVVLDFLETGDENEEDDAFLSEEAGRFKLRALPPLLASVFVSFLHWLFSKDQSDAENGAKTDPFSLEKAAVLLFEETEDGIENGIVRFSPCPSSSPSLVLRGNSFCLESVLLLFAEKKF
jgi:hypothetical protein